MPVLLAPERLATLGFSVCAMSFVPLVRSRTVLHSYHEMSSLELARRDALWELEVDALASETLVHFRVGIEAVVNTTTLLLIKHDLQQLLAILLGAQTLANNLNWVDEIGEDGIVDSSECSRTWSLLLLQVAGAVGALWSWEDTARGDDEDVTIGELLLEFAGQAE